MELELRKDYINCWENVFKTTLAQEETTEMIVPDARPDILQMLDGEGRLLLKRKEALDGKAELSGLIRAALLYQPDGESGVRSLDCVLPFSATVESSSLSRRSQIIAIPQVQKVEVHVLNPRKILVKVSVALDVSVYMPQSMPICPCVEDGEAYAMQQKTQEYRSHMTVTALEKMFHYSDVLNLPAGKSDMAELLKTRGDCICNEAKVIGNKLVFKGEARLELLYRSQDGVVTSAGFTLPFSQIMECDEAGEEALPQMKIIFTDISCKSADDAGRNISVELELLAQGTLQRTETRLVLTDLYSTKHTVEAQQKMHPICRLMDQGIAPESVREVLETGMAVESILDVQVRPGQLLRNRQNGSLELGAEVEVFVLFAAEGDTVTSLHRKLIVPHHIPISDRWEYDCEFWLSREPAAVPAREGLEISFTLDFKWAAVERSELPAISAVTVREQEEQSGDVLPSVIIRAVRADEELWDLAKAYHTTQAEISGANALASAQLTSGQMLLIPKV